MTMQRKLMAALVAVALGLTSLACAAEDATNNVDEPAVEDGGEGGGEGGEGGEGDGGY